MSWPPDPQNAYALWLDPSESSGAALRAYVTAHPVYRDIGVHSRFAVRLDLPGVYLSRSAAAADAIRSERPDNKGAVQTFNGGDSPFVHRTFPTALMAANYGLAHGERIVLGLVRGLPI